MTELSTWNKNKAVLLDALTLFADCSARQCSLRARSRHHFLINKQNERLFFCCVSPPFAFVLVIVTKFLLFIIMSLMF